MKERYTNNLLNPFEDKEIRIHIPAGIEYADQYFPQLSDRSLVSKDYVDAMILETYHLIRNWEKEWVEGEQKAYDQQLWMYLF